MKKIFVIIFTGLLVLTLVSCKPKVEPPIDIDEGYVVSFETNGGTKIDKIQLEEESTIDAPLFPKKDGYIFNGWYKDLDQNKIFDFSSDYITGPTKLYAKWVENKTDFSQTFKVLSIGNSFSEDAHKYLFDIAVSYGIDPNNIHISNMYIGGAELDKHVSNIKKDNAVYSLQTYTSNTMVAIGSYKLSQAIKDENWDVITFQQASHDSGLASKYGDNVKYLTKWAKENATNPNVQISWHMTWAYQQNSNHSGFINYDKSQTKMYEMITKTLESKVFIDPNINYLIPSGTAIQNARTSYVGDNLTIDGYHLSRPLGRYIAGLMFFKSITNFSVTNETIKYYPEGLNEEEVSVAFESVNNAYNHELVVTNSIVLEGPIIEEPVEGEATGVIVDFTYSLGFWGGNATSISPITDALHNKFINVTPIPIGMLPAGSEILLADGYQYRPIKLIKNGDGFKVISRGENITSSYVVVTEEMVSNAEYLSFNIAHKGNQVDLSNTIDEVSSKFKLYNPKGTVWFENNFLNFMPILGFWNNAATDISPESDGLHNKFVTTLPISTSILSENSKIVLEEGYQFRFIRLEKTETGFKVISRTLTNISNNETALTESFLEGAQYFSFNISPIVSQGDLTGKVLEVGSKLKVTNEATEEEETPPAEVVTEKVDLNLTFRTGYWEKNKSSLTESNSNASFLNRYIGSSLVSKSDFLTLYSIEAETNFEYRVIFINNGNTEEQVVVERTEFINPIYTIEDLIAFVNQKGFDYTHVAFTIWENGFASTNERIEEVAAKLTFNKATK